VTASQVSALQQLEESASSAARTIVQEDILLGNVYELLEPGYSIATRNTTFRSKVHGDVLEHRSQALESRAGSSIGTTQQPGSADRRAELERSLASAMMAISELKEITLSHKAELERTQAALATNHITMNGETFASPLVVSAYVLKHQIAGSVLWFDAVSLCQIASHDVLDHTQALSEHANAKKAGYDNPLTAQIVISFQITLPSLFRGSSGKSAVKLGSSRPLPIFKTYVSSSCFILESILITVRGSLNTVIIQSECSPQAQLLIRGMLQNSAMFLEMLFQFMQRFYCELTVVHKTDEVESWHLVASGGVHCQASVFGSSQGSRTGTFRQRDHHQGHRCRINLHVGISSSPSRYARIYSEQFSRTSALGSSGNTAPVCSSRSAWSSHRFGEQVQCHSSRRQGHQGDIGQGLTSRKRQLARLIRSRPCERFGV
jgi:hypothetical protein